MRWVVAGLVIVAILAASLLIGRDVSSDGRRLKAAAERSGETVTSLFAQVARRSLVRGSPQELETASALLLAGSATSVEIVVGGEIVHAATDEGWSEPEDAASSVASFGARWMAPPGVAEYLEVVVPLGVTAGFGEAEGYVRSTFDAAAVRRTHRSRVLALVGTAAGAAAAALAAGFVLQGRRRNSLGAASTGSRIRCGDLTIDRSARRVTLGRRELRLPPKPFALLELLAGRPGHVFADSDILAAVWPASAYADSSDVKQCVYSLRKRLGEMHPDPHHVVVNVKGYGYKLVPPAS